MLRFNLLLIFTLASYYICPTTIYPQSIGYGLKNNNIAVITIRDPEPVDKKIDRIDKTDKSIKREAVDNGQKGNKSFVNFRVSLLGLLDMFPVGASWGLESKINIDTKYIYIPIDIQWYDSDVKIKLWPQIFFSGRETPKDSSVFISPVIEGNVTKSESKNSNIEVGLGFGFRGDIINFGFWVSSTFYQGAPVIRDILAFEFQLGITPDPILIVFGFRIGIVLLNVGTGGINFTTSATTLELDILFGVDIYRGFGLIVGVEAGLEDLGRFISSTVQSPLEIDELISIILKFGLTFKF